MCKIADFSLSRKTHGNVGDGDGNGDGDGGGQYYRSEANLFPVRWTAPESMVTGKYNQASDVWAYGIV